MPDITITLTEQEQRALVTLLDMAVKYGGLQAAGDAVFFAQKLKAKLTDSPTAPEPPPRKPSRHLS